MENNGNFKEYQMENNGNFRICPTPQFGQESKGIRHGTGSNDLKEDVPAMKDTQQSNLSFLQWTKRVITEHPDALEYMLKSSDQMDRVIAKRIIKNASGGC